MRQQECCVENSDLVSAAIEGNLDKVKEASCSIKMTGETPEVRSDKKKPRMLLRHHRTMYICRNAQNLKKWPLLLLLLLDIH